MNEAFSHMAWLLTAAVRSPVTRNHVSDDHVIYALAMCQFFLLTVLIGTWSLVG